jgi:membrane-associated protease RseP (regulator of RpoE activity)
MVNLDTVGRLGNGKILVLGSNTADEWIHIVNGAGFVTGAPVEAVMNDPGGSDQKSFTDVLVPAVQVFTGANADYHKPGDTFDKIDGDGLVKVAAVTRELVAYLAERPNPLTSRLAGGSNPAPPSDLSPRRVSMGTVPDYAYSGPGVRISGTTPGSPAEMAGLQAGDVIVKVAGTDIETLKDFANALNALPPGAKVTVIYQRNGVSEKVEVMVVAR